MTGVLDLDQVRGAVGGHWIVRPTTGLEPMRVTIDSRDADLERTIFIALRGEHHDGHDHLAEVRRGGARLAIIDREVPDPLDSDTSGAARSAEGPMAVLRVDDTRRALGRLAHRHRRALSSTRVVAVTGSCGKTTTRRLIHGALRETITGASAERSYNNDIGVPLTLLGGRRSDRYLLVEIGTNAPGEVAHLAAMAEPDLAVITAVGAAHLAGLGSIDGVAREKSSLVAHLSAGAPAFVIDDARLDPYVRNRPDVWRFGESPAAQLRLTDRGYDARAGRGCLVMNGRERFDLGLPGRHNAINALAAIAVARRFGVTDEAISRGLAAVAPEAMRLAPVERNGVLFVNDAYNANPDSMRAALATFAELASDARRRIVVTGDMLELGSETAAEHRALGHAIAGCHERLPLDLVIHVGAHGDCVSDGLGPDLRRSFETAVAADGELAARVAGRLEPGDAVLLKGSRGIALERLIPEPDFEAAPSCSTTS